MQVIKSPNDILRLSSALRIKGKQIGLVPTMGALHQGHLSLVEKSIADNDQTIVSIFVNPLQFNNPEDLKIYPRTLDEDLELLKRWGVGIVYAPGEQDMYPEPPIVSIDFGKQAQTMEGTFRPGHFEGVGVVVAKLFHQCHPHRAYFGLKDLQQFLLIRKMACDLSFSVEVIGSPIIREASGLAMSSRNQRLSEQGKSVASIIFQGLKLAKEAWQTGLTPDETKRQVIDLYNNTKGLSIEYLHIVNPDTLIDLTQNKGQKVAFCVAGYVEGIRLIDNLYLWQD